MMGQQELIDTFYWSNGPCCAGCDWWSSHNTVTGECAKSAPVAAAERIALIGLHGCSLGIGAGHPFTLRSHVCGDFKDDFDWSTLPLSYRRRIGAKDMHGGD